MGSDEEYLDNLLKSVSGDSSERKAMTEEEIAALFSTAETTTAEVPVVEDFVAEEPVIEDFATEELAIEDLAIEEPNTEFVMDDILALDDTASDFDADIALEEDYDFVLDELSIDQADEPVQEHSLELAKEQPESKAAEPEFLDQEEVQNLIAQDAELFDMPEDQSDLVDLGSLDLDEELGKELLEEQPIEVVEVPDTEEIEQGDMLDIASMFGSDEDLTEGITYDTSGFYDDEPAEGTEEEFNPFADMSDIDELLKAVNWSAKDESEAEPGEGGAEESFVEGDMVQDALVEDAGVDSLSDGVFLEDMDQLTSEDLESMMPSDELGMTDGDEEVDALVDDFDLSSLGESEDADMAELGALLKFADGEADALDLFESAPDDGPTGVAILHGEDETPKERKARIKQEKAHAKAKKKAEKAAKKALKEVEDMPEPKYKKTPAEETSEKKESFFGKIMNILLEEEEEEAPKKKPTEEVIELDENGEIPDSSEDGKTGKKIKEKKEKPQKQKKEKSKKEKKAKPKKEKAIELEPPAKIRRNSVIIVVGFAASLLVFVLLGNAIVQPIISKSNAKKAFLEQQYEECYQLFAGQTLSEEEQMMLDHAGVVLKIQRRLLKYEEYTSNKDRLHAIDSLFDAVTNYDEWYQEALNCGARAEVEDAYADIISILNAYGVSESQAKEIASLDDVAYTRVITALAEGEAFEGFIDSGANKGELPDLLPGETD